VVQFRTAVTILKGLSSATANLAEGGWTEFQPRLQPALWAHRAKCHRRPADHDCHRAVSCVALIVTTGSSCIHIGAFAHMVLTLFRDRVVRSHPRANTAPLAPIFAGNGRHIDRGFQRLYRASRARHVSASDLWRGGAPRARLVGNSVLLTLSGALYPARWDRMASGQMALETDPGARGRDARRRALLGKRIFLTDAAMFSICSLSGCFRLAQQAGLRGRGRCCLKKGKGSLDHNRGAKQESEDGIFLRQTLAPH
jgi:hypothetical protein